MYSELYYKNLLQIKNGIGKIQLCFYLIKRVCEIKSVNRHSMISDGAVSSWNELAALVYITSI